MFERNSRAHQWWRYAGGASVILNAAMVAVVHIRDVSVVGVCIAAFFFGLGYMIEDLSKPEPN